MVADLLASSRGSSLSPIAVANLLGLPREALVYRILRRRPRIFLFCLARIAWLMTTITVALFVLWRPRDSEKTAF